MPSLRRRAPALRRRSAGLLLFASAQDEARVRRPTDIALALVESRHGDRRRRSSPRSAPTSTSRSPNCWRRSPGSSIRCGWSCSGRRSRGRSCCSSRRSSGAGAALPRDLRRRASPSRWASPSLARRSSCDDDPWAVVRQFADLDGPPAFPPGALTIAAAAHRHRVASRQPPFRHFGRWLIGGAVRRRRVPRRDAADRRRRRRRRRPARRRHRPPRRRLAGRPPDDVADRLALRGPRGRRRRAGAGVDARRGRRAVRRHRRRRAARRSRSTAATRGTPSCSPTSWRLAWYRDTQRTVRLSRLELVEHEGFVTLLADRAGVRVPRPRHGRQRRAGDALVVVRPDGVPLGDGRATLGDAGDRRRCGRDLAASTTPASPTAGSTSTGSSSATTARSASATSRRPSVAESAGRLLAGPRPRCSALSLAARRRGAGRRRRPGGRSATTALLPVLPYLQEAAMPPRRARRARRRATSSSTTSAAGCATLLGADGAAADQAAPGHVGLGAQPGPAGDRRVHADRRVRRHRPRVVRRRAARRQLVVAGVRPRARPAPARPGGGEHDGLDRSTRCRSARSLALQFAICYVNLAIPSTAARVADQRALLPALRRAARRRR